MAEVDLRDSGVKLVDLDGDGLAAMMIHRRPGRHVVPLLARTGSPWRSGSAARDAEDGPTGGLSDGDPADRPR